MKQPSQTSKRRQEASRRNGALSQGPVTPEGKARSSRNATVHGCLAKMITFDDGEAEVFNAILAEYTARFEPRDPSNTISSRKSSTPSGKCAKAWMYENSMLGLQIVEDQEAVDRAWNSIGDQDRRALALSASLAANKTIANLQRYTAASPSKSSAPSSCYSN